MHLPSVALWTAAFAGLGLTAGAQDGPPPLPTRDVIVTYRLEDVGGAGREGKIRLVFTAQSQRVRLDSFGFVEAANPYLSVIYDRPAGSYVTWDYAQRAIFPREADKMDNPGALLTPTLQYTRQGGGTVADLACTNWRFADATGPSGIACVTEDGVVLRLVRTSRPTGSMEAMAVEYGTPPDALFTPPPDLRMMVRKTPK